MKEEYRFFIHDFANLKLPTEVRSRMFQYSTDIYMEESQKRVLNCRKLKISHLGKVEGKHRFQIITLDIDIRNTEKRNIRLLKKLSYLFDDVLVEVDEILRITKVINQPQLINRWKNLKLGLLSAYKGESVEHYFKTIDDVVENEKMLIEFLHEHKMFGLFFNGYVQNFPIDKKIYYEETGFFLWAGFKNKDKSYVQIQVHGFQGEKKITEEYYFEESNLLNATSTISEIGKLSKYKLTQLGLRKNLQETLKKHYNG